MKDVDQQHYKETFASLPFTTIFALNDLEDQLGILNDLIIKLLEKHALMKRIQVRRQPAPWIDIVSLKNDCRHLQYQCHQTKKDDDWQSLRKSRNELKSKIKSTKKLCYCLNTQNKSGQLYTECCYFV